MDCPLKSHVIFYGESSGIAYEILLPSYEILWSIGSYGVSYGFLRNILRNPMKDAIEYPMESDEISYEFQWNILWNILWNIVWVHKIFHGIP